MRGVVMQPLRKYGDWFAILTSAFVFALMHGNLVQAPFAFIAGIGLGYAVIASGSLWTGILIHLLNNSISVIQTIGNRLSPRGKSGNCFRYSDRCGNRGRVQPHCSSIW